MQKMGAREASGSSARVSAKDFEKEDVSMQEYDLVRNIETSGHALRELD
jgi:hypothetical protein